MFKRTIIFFIKVFAIFYLILLLVINIYIQNFFKSSEIITFKQDSYKLKCGFVFYNIFNNKFCLSNVKMKNLNNKSLKDFISFDKIYLKPQRLFLFNENFIIDDIKFNNCKINLYRYRNKNFNISFFYDLNKLYPNNKNFSHSNNIESYYLASLNFIDIANWEYLIIKNISGNIIFNYFDEKKPFRSFSSMIDMEGKNILPINNDGWSNINFFPSKNNFPELFNFNLRVKPFINDLSKSSFSLKGKINNIDKNYLKKSLENLNLDCSSFDIEINAQCFDGIFDNSKLILNLKNAYFISNDSNSTVKRMRFSIPIEGSINNFNINYEPALLSLPSYALSQNINIIKDDILGIDNNKTFGIKHKTLFGSILNSIRDLLADFEDDAKDELRVIDEKLNLSELDDKFLNALQDNHENKTD